MAFSGRPSINKRNREQAQRERQQDKAQRRAQRADERKKREDLPEGEDPDLVGIVPGPQPRSED